MAFQLLPHETYTLARLQQVALQTRDIQAQYIERIGIGNMNEN